ncbi:protein phosphatase 1 regulatory subunit 35 isoform X1 [Ursus americanus]|uniref:protein phosphatase 1 regulatory subunit 35 isoform X1 n=1 Tax=Ursus americanus TaxID=9643 RepID=UPI001E679E2B|nr:protein phosphatase 1 regulatory subunit 35 isoform X1 [Ursus americanus]
MMGCGEAELELVEGEEALAAPGPPPEPRTPEPRAPVPEPGLDLSLSSRSETPERPTCCPGRRKGRADRRGGARKGRQVRFRLAPLSPVRSEPPPAAAAPSEKPAAPQDLGAPAQQSSLALSLELQAARAAAGGQFDAAKAVEEQLRKSFQTRCGLEESVAEGLNVPRSKRLFRDLVSLQVPEEQVLNAALREKLALLPPQARAPPPKNKVVLLTNGTLLGSLKTGSSLRMEAVWTSSFWPFWNLVVMGPCPSCLHQIQECSVFVEYSGFQEHDQLLKTSTLIAYSSSCTSQKRWVGGPGAGGWSDQ